MFVALWLGLTLASPQKASLLSENYRTTECIRTLASLRIAFRCPSGDVCSLAAARKLKAYMRDLGISEPRVDSGSHWMIHRYKRVVPVGSCSRPRASEVFQMRFKGDLRTYADFEIALDLARYDYMIFSEPMAYQRALRIFREWPKEQILRELEVSLQADSSREIFGVLPNSNKNTLLRRADVESLIERLRGNSKLNPPSYLERFNTQFLRSYDERWWGPRILDFIIENERAR